LLYIVTAVDCGPIPFVINARVTSAGATVYASQVTHECNQGMWFGRGVFVKISTCTEDGIWDLMKSSCSRKSTYTRLLSPLLHHNMKKVAVAQRDRAAGWVS